MLGAKKDQTKNSAEGLTRSPFLAHSVSSFLEKLGLTRKLIH
jgi:hypothetical protein